MFPEDWADETAMQNYNYDLGYYEGVRNILQMVIKNLQGKEPERKKVQNLCYEINIELEEALKMQKMSEDIFFNGEQRC